MIKILGIAGSLRKDSYNRAILRTAVGLTSENAQLEEFDLSSLPFFNADDEQNPPEVVRQFKEKIRAVDAILFVTPEYNYSVPGVLKNALDLASRPYGDSAWDGKPVGIMSASTGMMGGARAQYHLRQIFVSLNMYPLNQPEVMVPNVQKKFDNNGHLIDPHTKEKIEELLNSLVKWTISINGQER